VREGKTARTKEESPKREKENGNLTDDDDKVA